MATKGYEIRTIALSEIEPNDWNPNEQTEKAFGALVSEFTDEDGVGYIDLMQVVELESGKFRLIGGEHRWKALQVAAEEEADCVVLLGERWADEDLQKFVTMRLNAIKGNINPEKFMSLYEDLAQRHSAEDMQRHMAVTDDKAWKKMTSSVKASLKAAVAGGDKTKAKDALKKFDKGVAKAKTATDLSALVQKIMDEYGDTVDKSYLCFKYDNKPHIMIGVSPYTYELAKKLAEGAEDPEVLDALFGELLVAALAANA